MVKNAQARLSPTHITEPFVPTRLLDVSNTNICLVITRGSPLCYAALSYCWGSPEVVAAQVKTEASTIEQRKTGIRIDSLPATVRDAVMVCRALEIPYLWVDALCIIQGDRDDWERESYQMARVYEWAYLTIAAAQGDSCVSGMLADHPLPRRINIPFLSTLNPTISGTYSISSWPYPGSNSFSDGPEAPTNALAPDHSDDVLGAIWNTRAWTFQEMSMSTVILFFGDRMAHTHMRQGLLESEDGSACPLDHLEHATPYSFFAKDSDSDSNTGSAIVDLSDQDPQVWYSAVQHYSSRKLSYQSDKLPALSSFASLVAAKFRYESGYAAGLWASELHYGLLWFRAWPGEEHDDNAETKRPGAVAGVSNVLPWDRGFGDNTEPQVAPSWSWASRTFPVQWHRNYYTTSFSSALDSVDPCVDVQGLNPYGTIKPGAKLIIKTKIYQPPSSVCSLIRCERIRPFGELNHSHIYELRLNGDYLATLTWDGYVEVENIDMSQVSLLLTTVEDSGVKYEKVTMLGLLVVPSDGALTYRRVGIFKSEDDGIGGERFWVDIAVSWLVLI